MTPRARRELMRHSTRWFALLLIFGISACSQDDPLSELSRETGLSVVEVSVPFERFADAPASLQTVANVINNRTPGLYVLRYHDDTTRHILHVFAIDKTRSTYFIFSSLGGEQETPEQARVFGAVFDSPTKTLDIKTDRGNVRLTPVDVTPVGA